MIQGDKKLVVSINHAQFAQDCPCEPSHLGSVRGEDICDLLEELSFCTSPQRLLDLARIPFSFEQLRAGSPQRMHRAYAAALYRECTLALETHASRDTHRVPATQDEFDLLWRCAVTARTLREAINIARDFCGMARGSLGRIELAGEGFHTRFIMDSQRKCMTRSTYISDMIGLAMFHRMFSWLIGEIITPRKVYIAYPDTMADRLTRGLLPYPLAFSQAHMGISFDTNLLDAKVIRRSDDLLRLLPVTTFNSLKDLIPEAMLTSRVRAMVNEAIGLGLPQPGGEDIAAALGMTIPTLRRRLAREGGSLQRLRNDCLREQATALLTNTKLSAKQIAARLGYSDDTAFWHAFRGWTGCSPRQFRELMR